MYNKMLSAKVAYKKIMTKMMADMKKETVPKYDSAFTEAQIDKLLTYHKSEASKKIMNSSIDRYSKGVFLETMNDTTYKTYVFTPKRKERIDTLMNLMISKDSMNTYGNGVSGILGSILSSLKDTAQREKMHNHTDSAMKKISHDSSFAKIFNGAMKYVSLKLEVAYDKTLSDDEITYLNAYYGDPEVKKIQQISAQIMMSISRRMLPKYLPQMIGVFKMK